MVGKFFGMMGVIAGLISSAWAEGFAASLPQGRYYQAGNEVTIRLKGDQKGQGGTLELRDFRGNLVKRFPVSAGKTEDVKWKPDGTGGYFLVAWPGEAFDSFAVLPPSERRDVPEKSPYGVFVAYVDNFNMDVTSYALAILKKAGIPWIRATTFITPSGDGFDWSKRDRFVSLVEKNQLCLLSFFEEMGCPREWKKVNASTAPTSSEIGALNTEKDRYVLWNNPRLIEALADYATHYKGRLRYFEVWNEANDADGAETYLKYHIKAYQAIKAANPDAVVTETGFASLAYPGQWSKNFELGQVLQTRLLELGIDSYCDVYNFHYYPYQWQAEAIVPEYVTPIRKVTDKEIWITENGMGGAYPGNVFQLKGQAEYLVQSMFTALGLGCDKYFWFLLNDHPAFNMGLLSGDNRPKPVLAAYAAATWLLDDADWNQAAMSDENGVKTVRVPLRDGRTGYVYWSLSGQRSQPLPGAGKAYDLMGNEFAVADGQLTFGETPVYFIVEP